MHSCSLECAHDLTGIATALPDQYPYLLDSAAPGPLGELSLLLRTNGQHLSSHSDGSIVGPGSAIDHGAGESFLTRLDEWFQQERQTQGEIVDWPFIGGWFIYLGYELAAEVEPVVQFPAATDGFPVAFASRCPAAVYADPNQPGVLQLVAETRSLLNTMRNELENLQTMPPDYPVNLSSITVDQPESFKLAVEKIHEYILDGDVFQVNLSRGWQARFDSRVDAAAFIAPCEKVIRHRSRV